METEPRQHHEEHPSGDHHVTDQTAPTASANGQRAPGPADIAEQTSTSTPTQQFLCPYCGHVAGSPTRCDHCKGHFEPLSRQATQNHMGPWQLRDPRNPFQPGCSYATLRSLIARGKITRNTILRGPTTRQFWSFACNAPGVAVLLGECHSCHNKVGSDEYMCSRCNAVLSPPTDRQHLGLAPVKLLPGQASAAAVASSSMARPASAPEARRPAPSAPPGRAHGVKRYAPPPGAAGPRPGAEPARETVRRLRERVRFMTGVLVFAGVIIVAMMILFAVTMLADTSSLRFGRPVPATPTPATQPEPRAAGPITGEESEGAPMRTDSDLPADEAPEPGAGVVPEPMPPAVAESGAPAPDVTGLDPALAPWAADIRQAAELERNDTIEDLEAAVAILRRVLREATSAAPNAGEAAPSFPLLRARIDRITERIDRMRLRDVFN